MTDNIGDRMKRYEKAYDFKLTPRTPVFIRVDGKNFHTYTKNFNRPFDNTLISAMTTAAKKTAREMQNFKLAYVQSDECTFMLCDTDLFDTENWFNFEINKLVSIVASYFTFYFAQFMGVETPLAFDARAFNVPVEDWPNVFIWRQRDWERNSLQMLTRSQYTHSEVENKKTQDMHEMLHEKGLNWANLEPVYKNGTFITNDYQFIHEKLDYYQLLSLVQLVEEE